MPVNSLVAHVLLAALDSGEVRDVRNGALHGAVHGWMEGHLAASGHREGAVMPGDMPSPPFPDPDDPDGLLHGIVSTVMDTYDPDQVVEAFLHAVALGMRAGSEAGQRCGGCSISLDLTDRYLNAANIRAGLGHFAYIPPGG
ncbi:hypothetical protein NBH00_21435 [Paraconexibacter antarcticus]|uniref:Uncharacterized protein n=1 Tax=Paraconexibacter antarcticus TaxID=2949664 RepID=A0ABY5DTM1_9ACTN|nr:hypothetical protein [Paraconexibacter antarcticus]UTI63894.1 hypothetical protein NBH00_21435 [Paraconexibacter antarcticus]